MNKSGYKSELYYWLPLLASVLSIGTWWLPGIGGVIAFYAPIAILFLGIFTVFMQSRGHRLYSFLGLIAGYALGIAICSSLPVEKDPGPGEGFVLIFYFYGVLILGVAGSTMAGFAGRKISKYDDLSDL